MAAPRQRLALVTGGARGIGLAITRRLLDDGHLVTVVDRDGDTLETAMAELSEHTAALQPVTADVTDPAAMVDVLDPLQAQQGRLDVLVNNAATVVPRHSIQQCSFAEFDRVVATNTRAVHIPSLLARPLLAAGDSPAIVNLGSIAALRAFRGSPAYTASKGAVAALTRALALDLAGENIRVNAVAPSMTITEGWDSVSEEEYARRSRLVPLGRPVSAEEVAATVTFLASTAASGITGQVIAVDGGHSIQAYTPADEQPLYPDRTRL